ncbi:MAG: hypothetical protein JWO28_33 [Hyphomicrobiales bacterium]|jgi:hypothetical protein|nr:hypothetical protein [Hyphomicrobiales bacterium]
MPSYASVLRSASHPVLYATLACLIGLTACANDLQVVRSYPMQKRVKEVINVENDVPNPYN